MLKHHRTRGPNNPPQPEKVSRTKHRLPGHVMSFPYRCKGSELPTLPAIKQEWMWKYRLCQQDQILSPTFPGQRMRQRFATCDLRWSILDFARHSFRDNYMTLENDGGACLSP